MQRNAIKVIGAVLGFSLAGLAHAATNTCDAALNPTGTLGTPSFCITGEPAHIAVQLTVPAAKLVQCKWSFVVYGVAPAGAAKALKLLTGTFKAKYCDGTTPLLFTTDLSAKLNKQLAKKAILKKLPKKANEGALVLDVTVKPNYGGTEKTRTVVNATIYLTRFSISGTVTGAATAGVAMYLTGAASTSTATSANGAYLFSGLLNGAYTVCAQSNGFSFAPSYCSVTIDAANVSSVDFTAYSNSYSDMTLIPAGAFQMGTNNLPYEDEMTDAGPNHTVNLSAFYMDKYEVPYAVWTGVYQWALGNGYDFDNAGYGKAMNHPVLDVSWYDCVKWCNARSEMQGLTPCYYTDASQSTLYKSGLIDVANTAVKWDANGYRLPTEAEWEKAARGGAVGMRFPWSNVQTISRAQANYFGDINFAYDLGPNGLNPLFATGAWPYTSPVKYFAPNGYGLHDMAGNVREWCWDWYASTYYAISPSNNPRGPASTPHTYRVLRGGGDGWYYGLANNCRVANRGNSAPDDAYSGGFRCVRGF